MSPDCEADLDDRARQLVADLDLAQRHHRADRPGGRGPFAAAHLHGLDGLLRLRKGGARGDRRWISAYL